ncbi:hypothetical protein T484DRAFT_1907662, partial [Baffinella frigidus]
MGPEELNALLVQKYLQNYASVFLKLGVECVEDLAYVLDTDIVELELPKVATRKILAMLECWRKANAKGKEGGREGDVKIKRCAEGAASGESAEKSARADQAGEGGNGGGVGGIERSAAPADGGGSRGSLGLPAAGVPSAAAPGT